MTNTNRICTVAGCDGKHSAKGLCVKHYKRFRRTGSPVAPPKQIVWCSVEGCTDQVSAKGLCPKHYLQEYNRITADERKRVKHEYYLAHAKTTKQRAKVSGAISRRTQPEKHRERNNAHAKRRPDLKRANQRRRNARVAAADTRQILASEWHRLLCRYNHRCAYCGQSGKLTPDHIIPISRGGRHSIGNVLPACVPCNASKGTKFLVEWRQYCRFIESLKLRSTL